MGSTRRVLARQPAVLVPSPRVRRAFSLRGERPGQPGVWRPLHRRTAPFPSAVSGPGSQRLCALSKGTASLFLLRPQRAPPVGSQEVLRQEPGPVCRVGGAGFSGAEFAPFPSPCLLPPAGMGRLFSGVSLEFLSPFVLRAAGGVFRPVNFSLALPQFKKNLPPTALRAFWPVPTLSNAAGSSPFRPLLLVAAAGVWGTFLLGVAFTHVICGPYLISPPS